MVSTSGRTTNFIKEEKNLMAALGRVFPEAKNKGYDNTTLQKFNFQNPNGIEREMNSDLRMLEAAETPIQERT